MIKITINGLNVKVSGHSGYEDRGKDIICASISTACYMTVNQIELFGMLDCIEYVIDEAKPLTEITVNSLNETIENVMKNLIFTLKVLENQYPKYLSIKEN